MDIMRNSQRASRRTLCLEVATRGMSGGALAVNTYAGPQRGFTGGVTRDTLIDEFFNRDRCFGLNSARGIFYFQLLFGDFGCQKALGSSFLLQTRLNFQKRKLRALRAHECHGVAPENTNIKPKNERILFLSVG